MYLPSLPPSNEVWGKVMFSHLSVNHSVHRGRAVMMPLPVMDSTPSWTATPPPGQHHIPFSVNTLAIHILLECFLVYFCLSKFVCPNFDLLWTSVFISEGIWSLFFRSKYLEKCLSHFVLFTKPLASLLPSFIATIEP